MDNHRRKVVALFSAVLLAGCATTPMGPSVLVMPGPNKPLPVFQADTAACKDFANQAVAGQAQQANNQAAGAAVLGTLLGAALGAAAGGISGDAGPMAALGAAAGAGAGSAIGAGNSQNAQPGIQQQYDNAYLQCMFSKGDQVPGFQQPAAAPPPPPASAAPPSPAASANPSHHASASHQGEAVASAPSTPIPATGLVALTCQYNTAVGVRAERFLSDNGNGTHQAIAFGTPLPRSGAFGFTVDYSAGTVTDPNATSYYHGWRYVTILNGNANGAADTFAASLNDNAVNWIEEASIPSAMLNTIDKTVDGTPAPASSQAVISSTQTDIFAFKFSLDRSTGKLLVNPSVSGAGRDMKTGKEANGHDFPPQGAECEARQAA